MLSPHENIWPMIICGYFQYVRSLFVGVIHFLGLGRFTSLFLRSSIRTERIPYLYQHGQGTE